MKARPRGVSRAFHEALLAKLKANDLDLPELDEAAARVVAHTADPAAELDEAANALAECPYLAKRVLEVARSALYTTQEPAEDIRTAAGRLGLRAIGELAIVALVRDKLYGPLLASQREVQDLWRHAAVAGVYAHRLTRMRWKASEASLLAGLLADVGKPLVHALILEIESAISKPIGHEARHSIVEALHVAVGLALVRSWNLPRPVILAVTFHHNLEGAPPGSEEAAIACLCDHLARRLFTNGGSDEDVLAHPAARILELTESQLERLLGDPEEILEAANTLT